MRRLGVSVGTGRLIAVVSLFAIALVAVLGVPLLASAGESGATALRHRQKWENVTIQTCEDRAAGEHPRMDEFLGELVTDAVISQEQADEIERRLVERGYTGCVALVLFQPGTMVEATAGLTGTEPRDVIGWLVAGDSLSAYAAQYGYDDAALVTAIMAGPESRAAELVASGELDQATADMALACIEEKVNELILEGGLNPRRHHGAGNPGDLSIEGVSAEL